MAELYRDTWVRALCQALCLLAVVLGVSPAFAQETLVVWHAYRGDEKAALDQVLAAFEKERSVRVEALQVPHDAYASKLTAAVPRGHGPHVFIDSHERIGDLEERGVVATLSKSDFDASLFPPSALEALASGDRVRGLPLAFKCIALYVNQTLVPRVPDTFEEIAALPGLPPGTVPIAYEARNMYFHAAILHAFGGTQLGPGESFGFSSEPGARSIDFVRDLIAKGAVPDEASGAVAGELFKTGRAATAISGPWFASDLGSEVKYRVVPLPRIAAAGEPMRPYLTVEAASLTPRGAESPTRARAARVPRERSPPQTCAPGSAVKWWRWRPRRRARRATRSWRRLPSRQRPQC